MTETTPTPLLTSPKVDRTFTLVRDTMITYPDLFLEVYIVGDRQEQAAFAELFLRGRCTKTDLPEDADLVVFTGGADVNPSLYGEDKHHSTYYDDRRDAADMEVYALCLEKGIPMFGVCRGAQFLHVMNGGRLYQDVDNHNGDHPMFDTRAGRLLQKVSSVHHQMCIPNVAGGMEILGTSAAAKKRWRNPTEFDAGTISDVEAYFYRDTCCFGVQGHPEYRGYYEFAKWTLERLNEVVNENPDITLINGNRRMKPELIAQRDIEWAKTIAANNTLVIDEKAL